MNKTLLYIVGSLSLLICNNGFSQTRDLDSLILRGKHKPTLSESFKISERPQIDPPTNLKPDLTYQINSKRLPTKYDLDPISAARMSGEPLTKFYKSLLKLGWGTYTSPMVEYYFNTNRSKKHSLGAYFKHFSSDGTIKNTPYSGFSQNDVKFYADKFFKTHTLTSSMQYKRDAFYFYGLGTTGLLGDYTKKDFKEDFGQYFQTFDANIGLNSVFMNHDRLHHDLNLRYKFFGDNFSTYEHLVALEGKMEREIELDADLQNEKITLDFEGVYNNTAFEHDTLNSGLVCLKPMVEFTTGDFKFKGGLAAYAESELETNLRFMPTANLSLDIIENMVALDAGIGGKLIHNNFNSLATTNPFIISDPELRFTREKMNIYAGIRGNLSKTVSFLARLDRRNLIDMPFFVNDTNSLLQNRFDVIYDDVQILKVSGEVAWQKNEKFRVSLDGKYNNYTMENEMKPWHMPTLEINLGTQYNLKDKIIARLDVFYNNSSYARQFNYKNEEYAKKLKGLVDVNLGLEYRYTSILSAFIKFNNVAAQKYAQWYGYPSQRFSVLGGFTYAF